MTPDVGFCSNTANPDVNWRNLGVACQLAEKSDATTCLITGKGEPTLYPDLITKYIEAVADTFPFIELQTNGMKIKELNETTTSVLGKLIAPEHWSYLKTWYEAGLTTVCLSAVDFRRKLNQKVYSEEYPELTETIEILHKAGFSVRLSMMMIRGGIDSTSELDNLVHFCLKNKVEQLTVRPIDAPPKAKNNISNWVDFHTIPLAELNEIKTHVSMKGNPVLKLSHGATVYDFQGQNLCLANCLTTNDTDENMRQIIYFPDGTIGYDWKYKGARLL
jgi:wyosine [tRNA(Phe)-imidazoG37] synthetase (radical SAM superfamily)